MQPLDQVCALNVALLYKAWYTRSSLPKLCCSRKPAGHCIVMRRLWSDLLYILVTCHAVWSCCLAEPYCQLTLCSRHLPLHSQRNGLLLSQLLGRLLQLQSRVKLQHQQLMPSSNYLVCQAAIKMKNSPLKKLCHPQRHLLDHCCLLFLSFVLFS